MYYAANEMQKYFVKHIVKLCRKLGHLVFMKYFEGGDKTVNGKK